MAVPHIALISPAVRELHPRGHLSFITYLRSKGALAVFPVDAGIGPYAELVADEAVASGRSLVILGACPAAKEFVRREFPLLAPYLSDIPSPMSLIAAIKSADLPRGPGGEPPYALAVTPCGIKKTEGEASGGKLRVQTLPEFFREAEAEGVDPGSLPPGEYDPWDAGEGGCAIGRRVADALGRRGVAARALKFDGAAAAAKGLSALDRSAPGVSVIEITFCEGGCKRGGGAES